MKTFIALLFAGMLCAAGDVHFYSMIEQPPSIVPNTGPISGVLIVVTSPVAQGSTPSACVGYTTTSDNTKRTACVAGLPGFNGVRLNLGADKSDFTVDSIAVTLDGVTKTVQSPAMGTEY